MLGDARANLCENVVQVRLTWRESESVDPLGDTSKTETISGFVQLLDGEGRLMAQQDGPPLQLRPNLIQLQAGWRMIDRRALAFEEGRQPAQMLVGIYDFVTGQRVVALDALDLPLPENGYRFPVEASCEGTDLE